MEAVGVGDLHFGKLNKTLPIDVDKWIGHSIRRVLAYALANGIRNVFFYGDIFDRPVPTISGLEVLAKILLNPKFKDLNFHFILGNHDFAEDGHNSMNLMHVISKFTDMNLEVYVKPEGVRIDGIPFMMLPHPYKDTSKKHVNIGHFEQEGAVGDSGRVFKEGFSTDHFTLIGHLHTRQKIRKSHWSGTLFQCNFGESLPKFFHHITIESLSDYRVRCVPFDPPWRLVNLTVNSRKDLKQLVLEERIYYKLFVQSGVDVDMNEVLQANPNIIKTNVFTTKAELKLMVESEWKLDDEAIDTAVTFDEETMLSELLSNEGLTKKQIGRGIQRVKNLRSS